MARLMECRRGRYWMPDDDPPDSGIDSDHTGEQRFLYGRVYPQILPSSSDESSIINNSNAQLSPIRVGDTDDDDIPLAQEEEEEENDLIVQYRHHYKILPTVGNSPERSSPPLYEVELTASDEDDDASVLELVIPMHKSRYQRVPTSSPKKSKPKLVKRYFCSMICCGRNK